MALGNIGKVIAGQAFDATKKGVMDALVAEPAKAPEKPPERSAPEPIGALILGQIQGMQRALREDQELIIEHHTGAEVLRITEIFVPSLQLLVLSGMDANGNITRVIAPADSAKLVCRIVGVAAGAKALRVSVLSPRPKPEAAP
jgi:hypothetical protein